MADLKSSIFVSNQFSVHGGDRSQTPGSFVTEYAARLDATEELAPVLLTPNGTVPERFDIREQLVEDCIDDQLPPMRFKRKVKRKEALSGRTFSESSISLSGSEVLAAARRVQDQFDNHNKTAYFMVISLSEEYVRERGLVSEDFQMKGNGSYRGQFDQLKLRMAIQAGMREMAKGFDDLHYIAAIQFDTGNAHCHLTAWDEGPGRLRTDGQQKGKLTQIDFRRVRRGMDKALRSYEPVRHMSRDIQASRGNVRSFVKRLAHGIFEENGVPQFLIACLPADKSLWDANSVNPEMHKANAIANSFVDEILAQRGSGYKQAQSRIYTEAARRAERDGLNDAQAAHIVQASDSRLRRDCVDAVYDVLRELPDEELTVHTPMLDLMSMDYDDLAQADDGDEMVRFAYRLRSFSSRLDYHSKKHGEWTKLAQKYEVARSTKGSDSLHELAVNMHDFAVDEALYHECLVAKYRHFLAFLPPIEEYKEELERLQRLAAMREQLDAMIDDESFGSMSSREAERYGLATYGHPGGSDLSFGNTRHVEARLSNIDSLYKEVMDTLTVKLAPSGLMVKSERKDGHVQLSVGEKDTIAFDEVKAYDLHHLIYDFSHPVVLPQHIIDQFEEALELRSQNLEGALEFLRASGQQDAESVMPVADIESMRKLLSTLKEDETLPSRKAGHEIEHQGRTVSLDAPLGPTTESAVRDFVSGVDPQEYVNDVDVPGL